ncbi:hypothetical protein [Streptacidiphilus sp. EB103A]|uniref:hypothetical protein n=1 Tax=Streptacidiphilus sp. EB103A TaxID=3156275 RepID=UPI0035113731
MRTTNFRVLVQQKNWTTLAAFSGQWKRACQEAAQIHQDARLKDIPLSERNFSRWMLGETKSLPRPDTRRVLEYLFGMAAEQLFAEPEAAPALPAPVTAQVGSSDVEAYPLSPASSWDVPGDILYQARAILTPTSDPALLALAAETIADIVSRYEALGPQPLVGEARMLRKMLHVLLRGHPVPAQRQDLFTVAAQASGLLGYMATNAGHAAAAAAYCTEALALAESAGDTALMMWVLGTRSFGLYYSGRFAEADAAAEAGIRLAPDSPQAIRLLVNGRARALARLGDPQEANRAIGLALELSDRQPSLPEGITSCIAFGPYSLARTLANAVTAHLSIGEVEQVLAYATQLEDLIDQSDSRWTRALVSLDVATALVQQPGPDLEQSMALGVRALRVSGSAPIQSVWQRGHELHRQARRWQEEAVVRDYAEELRGWTFRPEPDAAESEPLPSSP